jgi:hypothetical protein
MIAVWKFPFPVNDALELEMPADSKILSVQVQNDTPCLWALVDSTRERQTRKFRIYGTGHPCFSEVEQFIATFQMLDGGLVFHLFEER